jgi:hypothetical protein
LISGHDVPKITCTEASQVILDGLAGSLGCMFHRRVSINRRRFVFGSLNQKPLMKSNWVTTTLAGKAGVVGSLDGTNSGARFTYPTGVAVDSAGGLYVAE